MCFLPQDDEGARLRRRAARALRQGREGQTPARLARRADRHRPGSARPCSPRMPVIRQAIVGRGPQAAPTRTPSSASCWRSASRPRTRWPSSAKKHEPARPAAALHAVLLERAPSSTRACCSRTQVGSFYDDLRNPLTAVGARRWSTSASRPTPSRRWQLAHPYRFIAHNGEINTVRGNVNWMNARRRTLESDAARRRPRQDVADHPARPVGHRLPRQRARAAGRRRLLAAARDDDADPGGLGRQSADGCQAPGLLRVSRRADGAVGRPGRDRLHRRPPDRRDARPQRPAPRALPRHRRRPGRHGLGSRRAADPRGEDRPQVAAAARQDAADRPRGGPHRRGRGDEGARSPRPSPTRSGWSETQYKLEGLLEAPTRRRARRSQRSDHACSIASRPSATPRRTCKFFLEPMAQEADDPIGSMGTDTPIAVLSQPAASCSTTISSRTSPRSPTRRSIRSARSW